MGIEKLAKQLGGHVFGHATRSFSVMFVNATSALVFACQASSQPELLTQTLKSAMLSSSMTPSPLPLVSNPSMNSSTRSKGNHRHSRSTSSIKSRTNAKARSKLRAREKKRRKREKARDKAPNKRGVTREGSGKIEMIEVTMAKIKPTSLKKNRVKPIGLLASLEEQQEQGSYSSTFSSSSSSLPATTEVSNNSWTDPEIPKNMMKVLLCLAIGNDPEYLPICTSIVSGDGVANISRHTHIPEFSGQVVDAAWEAALR